MGPARLQLLDGFAFERGDELVAFPVALQRVLAFLALHGPVHRCVLAGTLWPEVPEDHSLASLRTAIWRINRLVPGLLVARGHGVAMLDTVVVDSREQERYAVVLLRERLSDDGLAEESVVLRGTSLLPGWYDDWVVTERERLRHLRVRALERTAVMLLRAGRVEPALEAALEAVRAEPLRETSNAALISVFLAEGNVVDARRQYEVFRSMLGRELGVVPSPRLESLLPPPAEGSDAAVTAPV